MLSSRSSGQDRKDIAAHTLVLDEGVLVGPDGGAELLWSVADTNEMQAAAQVVSERAWVELDPAGTIDADQLGAIVAAASKLDVYLDFCSYYRNSKLLERSIQRASPAVIDWRAHEVRPIVHSAAAVRSSLVPGWAKKPEGGATGWLKQTKWEWSARALAGFLEKGQAATPPTVGIDVLGVFDVRNTGMIQNVGRVVDHLSGLGHNVMGVSMHAQVTKQARSLIGLGSVQPLARFSRAADVIQALQKLSAVERAVRRFCEPTHADSTVNAAAKYAFRGLHAGYILQTLVDFRAIERMLDVVAPKAIVLASDAHRYSRLIVSAARTRGIPTAVLQHGALVIEDFYVPVVADQMLAWGEWCREWFTQRGTPSEKVTSVGFVRGVEPLQSRTVDGPPQKLLFAAQPLTERVNEDLLSIVRSALERDPSLTVTVRPHPGEGRRAELLSMVARWPAAVSSRSEFSPVGRSLESDLAEADAVIISQSTVGIDALSAGVPVLLLRHADVPEPIPYLEFGGVIEVNGPEELVSGIKALDDKAVRSELVRAATSFLEAYVGRVGAESVAAAANAVCDLMAGSGDPS